MNHNEQPIKTDTVLARYRITPKTLCQWKKKRGLPHYKIGRDDHYYLSELETWERAYRLPLPLLCAKKNISTSTGAPLANGGTP